MHPRRLTGESPAVRQPPLYEDSGLNDMIEGFEPSSLVIVNLVNPKEKFFGVLSSLTAAGVTVRAINLDSFDDWTRQLARKDEPNIDLLTMFFPLFRVERIFLDEPSGSIKSYSERFEDVVGRPIRDL